jgi:hypothetical protein
MARSLSVASKSSRSSKSAAGKAATRKTARGRSASARSAAAKRSPKRRDQVVLLQVAAKIAADPSLKPTAALRACGVTKEVDLRRLRARYNLQSKQLMADARMEKSARPAATPASPFLLEWPKAMSANGAVTGHVVRPEDRPRRAMPLDAASAVKTGKLPFLPRGYYAEQARKLGMIGFANNPWLAAWFGSDKKPAQTPMQARTNGTLTPDMVERLFKLSPIGLMLRGQALVNDVMLGILRTQSKLLKGRQTGKTSD